MCGFRHAQLIRVARLERRSPFPHESGLAILTGGSVPVAAGRRMPPERQVNAICGRRPELGSSGQCGEKRTFKRGSDLRYHASMGGPGCLGRKGPDPARSRRFWIIRGYKDSDIFSVLINYGRPAS